MEKGTTEDEMIEWHQRLSGHDFEQTLGDSEGQGRLVCYIQSMGVKETRLSNRTTRSLKMTALSLDFNFLVLIL